MEEIGCGSLGAPDYTGAMSDLFKYATSPVHSYYISLPYLNSSFLLSPSVDDLHPFSHDLIMSVAEAMVVH